MPFGLLILILPGLASPALAFDPCMGARYNLEHAAALSLARQSFQEAQSEGLTPKTPEFASREAALRDAPGAAMQAQAAADTATAQSAIDQCTAAAAPH